MLDLIDGPNRVIAMSSSWKITGEDMRLPKERDKALAWIMGASNE